MGCAVLCTQTGWLFTQSQLFVYINIANAARASITFCLTNNHFFFVNIYDLIIFRFNSIFQYFCLDSRKFLHYFFFTISKCLPFANWMGNSLNFNGEFLYLERYSESDNLYLVLLCISPSFNTSFHEEKGRKFSSRS